MFVTLLITFSIVRSCYDVNAIVQCLEDIHAVVKRVENYNVIKGLSSFSTFFSLYIYSTTELSAP